MELCGMEYIDLTNKKIENEKNFIKLIKKNLQCSQNLENKKTNC